LVHTAIAGPRGDLHEALGKVAVERSRAAHYQRRRMQLPCRRSRGSGTGDAEVSEREIELARHALGLPNKRRCSYRNYFVAGPGHIDYEHWQWMVFAGNATVRRRLPLGGDHCFYLTDNGAIPALRSGEWLDPEDFPTDDTALGEREMRDGG
jgi:hypothetical protein